MTLKLGAIILAAGFSNRFGGTKLTARLENGNSVYGQTMSRIEAAESAIAERIVVTRPEIAEQLMTEHAANIHVFNRANEGMGASLAFAIGLVKDWDACLVCLADMPFIDSETYGQMASHLSRDNILLPDYQGKIGNPVGFGSKFFPQLSRLEGDAGGRSVVQGNKDVVQRLKLNDPAILQDVDTPADLARYQNQ